MQEGGCFILKNENNFNAEVQQNNFGDNNNNTQQNMIKIDKIKLIENVDLLEKEIIDMQENQLLPMIENIRDDIKSSNFDKVKKTISYIGGIIGSTESIANILDILNVI